MTFDTNIELKKTFHEAMMQHAQGVLKTGPDWAEADKIIKDRKEERSELRTAYGAEVGTRIEAERQRLSVDTNKLTLEHPAPRGVVQDKGAAITRQAKQNVENAHQNDLQGSRDGEQKEMDQLMERAQSRDQKQGLAQEAFSRAAGQKAPERKR
jgi:aconitase A